ncbi:magnesium/cobalt transporter CorA [Conexibacter woesei]|uniref:Magnesium transport protein CorA n=1 Tax=Conexibacter woesei (strain DSM 14684 / CCUG 47730 / CIP 108061 / JCM 11494 / NBRC 100937 / ID131577) TaxID=469383 RepID=D3F5P4_CONWI|nr:magnesium/cobalt transporter CorA [Conexibacter woesei]ADB52593.1 magnesium and cobalt transport protein CorA [Conexibacter woesei DSM 14684]
MEVLDAIDDRALDALLARREFFWLDLVGPSDEEVARLGARFGWHPLAIEDTQEFRQRPKLDRYGDHTLLVFYGARDVPVPEEDTDEENRRVLVEVHLLISGDWVVTVRKRESPELDDLRRRLASGEDPESEAGVVYRILDTLTDTFFPVLEAIDDAIDRLEDAILISPGAAQLQRVFHLKRKLLALRRVVTPQRDLAQRTISEIADLPGLDPGSRDYFRDVYDHLIRVSDMVDSYRDLLSGTMDVYLSTTSNRQNAVMKQLTIVSTIFLPVTALTGFFGMNFGWLVGHIDTLWSFLLFGVGGALLAAIGLLVWFKRARFLES